MTHEKLPRKLWRIVSGTGSVGRYAVIGMSGVTIDFVIFLVLFRMGVPPLIATSLSTGAGISNNYVWNSWLNFNVKVAGHRALKFLTVGLVGLTTSAGILQFLISLGTDPVTAKVLSVPFVVSGQFLANRYWTFQHK